MPRAEIDPALGVRVIGVRELRYDDRPALGEDRPQHVRAASGLAMIGGRLAVVQDDAAFIAYVSETDVSAIALPRGAGGRRRFEVGLGNKMDKLDLEACIAVGDELWAFGSGSSPMRERIAIIGYMTRMHDAAPLYRDIREELGGPINLEGAALVGGQAEAGDTAASSGSWVTPGSSGVRLRASGGRPDEQLWLFHRGNTGPADLGPAIVKFSRRAFTAWLASDGPIPPIVGSLRFDLGSAAGATGGVRLGFTDAVAVGSRVFYLAAAEDSANAVDDGGVLASQLGVIDGDRVRATPLALGKAEGLAFDPNDPTHAWIAIDPDDVDRPAQLFEISLVGPW